SARGRAYGQDRRSTQAPAPQESRVHSRVFTRPPLALRVSDQHVAQVFPSPTLHLAALALCAADVTVRAIRLRLLVPGGSALSLWRAVTINAYGDAASAITPARLGGDPARFAGCRRAGIDTPRALA